MNMKTLVWKFAEKMAECGNMEATTESLALEVDGVYYDKNGVPYGVLLMDGSVISQLSNGDWEHLSDTGERIGRYHETK